MNSARPAPKVSDRTDPTNRPSVAVVTGAASGMGALLTRRLARRGTVVHALDRSKDALEQLAADVPGVEPHVADVTDAGALDSILRPLAPQVDLLVTAAGIGHTGRLADTAPATFARLMKVNYLGTVNTVTPVVPALEARGSGRIVLFASMAGWIPGPSHGPYGATKAAVLHYAEVLRAELARSGVKVHCVCPPAVATPLLDDMPASRAALRFVKPLLPERVIDAIERATEAGRFWVFPDTTSQILWRARRHAPELVRAAVTTMMGRGPIASKEDFLAAP